MAATRNQLKAKREQKSDDHSNQAENLRGNKRKRKLAPNSDGEGDSGKEEKEKRNRPRLADESADVSEIVETSVLEACTCPSNIMTCIGILPSLPIVNKYCDSDDSNSSAGDDTALIVLPRVDRNPKGGEEC